MAPSSSSCSCSCSSAAISNTTAERRRQYIFKYGVIVVCIALINVPACLQRLQSKLKILQVPSEWKTTKLERHSALVPVVGHTKDDYQLFQSALAEFTKVLHDDPKKYAVRPWLWTHNTTSNETSTKTNSSTTDSLYYFPGLSSRLLQDAFLDKRVALIGDSTLFYMTRWLQTLLMQKTLVDQDSLQTLTMGQANLKINPMMTREQLGWGDAAPALVQKDFVRQTVANNTRHNNETTQSGSYQMVWDGFRSIVSGGERFDILWERVRQWQPNILVVNAGLHWLHFQGGGRDSPLTHVRLWTDYEAWLDQVVQLAEEIGTTLLLFKTTNLICERKYVGVYANTSAMIEQERQGKTKPTFVQRCVEQLQQLQIEEGENTQVLSKADITKYCQEGTFDEVGVQNLNDRLFRSVQNMINTNAATLNLTISIFNDHDVMSCGYTRVTDGRHYHPLNLLRIRLLANMVQALY